MKSFKFSNSTLAESGVLWGSLLLILIMPFDEGGNGYILQLIIQLILLLGGIGWTAQAIHRREITFRWYCIDWWVAGFLLWSAGSLIIADYRYAAIFELIKLLSYAAWFYLLRTLFPLQHRQTWLLAALLASSLVQVIVGVFSVVIHHTPILQAGFVNPNELACLLVLGSTIALSVLLLHRKPPRFQKTCEIILGVTYIGLGVAVLSLQSRGGAFGLVVTGFLLTMLRNKKASLLFLALMLAAFILPLPRGSLLTQLQKRGDAFAYQRVDIWQSSLKMFSDHPITGVGLGMFKYYGAAYNFPVAHQIARYGKRLDLAHSDFLQISAESGSIGLLLVLSGLLTLGVISVRQLRTSTIAWPIAAASVGLLGVMVQGLVSTLLLSPALAMSGVVLAVILSDGSGMGRERRATIPATARSVWQWYAGLGVVGVYLLVLVVGAPFFGHRHLLQYEQLRRQGKIQMAVEHLRKAIRWAPIQAYYHAAFGQLYATAFRNQPNLDAFYEGYYAFTEAIRHNPREGEFYVRRADLHREMFRRKLSTKPTAENAIRDYQRALQYDPFNPFIRVSLATLYADLHEFDLALAALQEAVTLEPNFVGGHQLLGQILTHLERQAEAQAAFARADAILTQYRNVTSDSDYVRLLLRPLL